MISRAVLFERFTGRDEELEHLISVRAQAIGTMSGRTVSIRGEAGIGKSRLLTEFEAAVHAERGMFVRVRCDDLAVPFSPIAQALEILSAHRDLRRRDVLVTALDLLRIGDANAHLDGAERHGAVLERLVAAITTAAKALGQLTLAVEDVHWSDLVSLEALRAFARLAPKLPLVIVITYRPDDLSSDHARALAVTTIERETVDRITLAPLGYGDVAKLLQAAVPTLTHAASRRVYELSEGRPYVAEELARTFAEPHGDLAVETTLSLRSAVLGRVARLDVRDREIIDRAAVLGRNFMPDDLSALGISQQHLIVALRAAHGLQLFEDREVAGRPWFRFRHALTREILYQNVSVIERRELHLAIAKHLQSQGNRTAELAYHLAEAHESEKAIVANELAGDEAAAIAAFADAAKHFTRTLDFDCDAPTVARVGLKLVEALASIGELDRLMFSTRRLIDATNAAMRADDSLAISIVAIRAVAPTRLNEALSLFVRATSMTGPHTSSELLFELAITESRLLRMQGRHAESIDACARAETHLKPKTAAQRLSLQKSRAYSYLRMNDLDAAQGALEAQIDGESKAFEVDPHVLMVHAMISWRRGKAQSAIEQCVEAARRLDMVGLARLAYQQRCNAAYYASELGDFAFVRSIVEQSHRDGIEFAEALRAAEVRMTRAMGGDPTPFVEAFEREYLAGTSYMCYMLGRDIPYMIEDPILARSITMRAIERLEPGELEGDLVQTMLEFCDDEVAARTIKDYEATDFDPADLINATDTALLAARIAARRHRRMEAHELAREAVAVSRRTELWLPLSGALEMAGDLAGARAVLSRVGATAELARLERRCVKAAPHRPQPEAKLTPRERQIALLMAAGHSSREAGERLAIAARTVETHIANIYQKLGINSRAELAEFLEDAR